MGAFFIYIFKSAVCLALFYLFFRLLLSKETFHRFNRIVLLGGLCLAWFIPVLEITTSHQLEVNQAVLTVEQLLMMVDNVSSSVNVRTAEPAPVSVSWIHIALLTYLAGILFFAFRNLYSLGSLIRLMLSGKREKLEKGITLIIHEKAIAPFSWMTFVVISRIDLKENGREILIHEMAHLRNRHSIDLLLADICIFFQWFNPAAWLLKQELQNIHEYEADETVLHEGINAKEYQLLLIRKAVGTRIYSMVNSFNHSKLKKRITMMLKEKSNPWARLKCLYILPLAAVAVTVFARPEVSKTVEEIATVKVNDLTAVLKEEMPRDTVKTISATSKVEIKEVQLVMDLVQQVPQFFGGQNALHRYLNKKVSESPLKDKKGEVIVGFTISETGKVKDVKVINSNEVSLNDEALRIIREMPDWIPGKQCEIPIAAQFSVPVKFSPGLEVRLSKGTNPLLFVDGEEIRKEKFEQINPDLIDQITVLKDSSATQLYGARAVDGVILVTTKVAAQKNAMSNQGGETVRVTVKKEKEIGSDILVNGTVIDDLGRPKAGVGVIVRNIYSGAITDKDGHFRIKALKGDKISFTFVGYESVESTASSTMKIQMKPEVIKLLDY